MVLTVRVQSSSESVAFRDELPVPDANIAVYEQVYVLEQWLRRLLYASLMARYGNAWQGSLPSDLLRDLKRRLRQIEGRVHLDCENSDNVIWLLTLDELQTLLLADGSWPVVKSLSGLAKRVLGAKLREIREIRNVVGHSRAVSGNTAVLAAGVAISLEPGIDHFKTHLLYDAYDTIHLGEKDGIGVPGRFTGMVSGNDWGRFQPMLGEGEHFFTLTRLPVEPFDRYLSIRRFLQGMGAIKSDVLAVLVNRSGDEFSLVWPKRSPDAVHARVMQFFFSPLDEHWTRTPYERQRASAVCDPQVWFYENQQPRAE